MSDRSSAYLFAIIFQGLAEENIMFRAPDQVRALARYIWKQLGNYDFSPYQMECDDALVTLRLARRVRDEYNPDETVTRYGPVD